MTIAVITIAVSHATLFAACVFMFIRVRRLERRADRHLAMLGMASECIAGLSNIADARQPEQSASTFLH